MVQLVLAHMRVPPNMPSPLFIAYGRDVDTAVWQREARWRSDAYVAHAKTVGEDVGTVSDALMAAAADGHRQPGNGTTWGRG